MIIKGGPAFFWIVLLQSKPRNSFSPWWSTLAGAVCQGNVKVSAKVLIFRVCGGLKIRNTDIAWSYKIWSKQSLISNIKWPKHVRHLCNIYGAPPCLKFWILVIRICFGFRASCFEFIENWISKQFLWIQEVISLNDVVLLLIYSLIIFHK